MDSKNLMKKMVIFPFGISTSRRIRGNLNRNLLNLIKRHKNPIFNDNVLGNEQSPKEEIKKLKEKISHLEDITNILISQNEKITLENKYLVMELIKSKLYYKNQFRQ